MMKLLLAGTLCGLALVGCDKDDENEVNEMDKTFAVRASISNNAEVAAGQVAATKGASVLVRMFGQQMVTEHTAAQADLRSRASAVGLSAPDTVDAEHRAKMAYLNSLSGRSFDTAYINSQVVDHAKTIDLFNQQINNGNAETLRGYAREKLPNIQMHYAKADSIRRAL